MATVIIVPHPCGGAGATIPMALENQFGDARRGQLADPFGHNWSIGGQTTT